MAERRVQRRLAAILAADIVGYSRLMEADEAGTLARVKALRDQLLDPRFAEYGGRIVKTTGDGTLVEFPSAVDAVNSAVEVQQELALRDAHMPLAERIELRIGINVGDIIIDGDEDIYGDGVNVAARLEALAEPGGICVSAAVLDHVRDKIDSDFVDLGEKALKNIARPVRAYSVVTAPAAAGGGVALAAFDLPSIAVLPFDNMSGDPDQEFFSDGITEDLITALSRVRRFRVIARNSTFTFKGRSRDIRAVARELGVRYVVEGSVRKAGNRIRVSAQLIEGATGNHVWATRYDRDLEDIFGVQDELTETLVGAIEPELAKAEQVTARRKPPDSLSAWECYQKAQWYLNLRNKEAVAEARRLFTRAGELDPNFAPAFAGLADTYRMAMLAGDRTPDRRQALEAARRALQLDQDDPYAHVAMGSFYIADRDPEAAVEELEQAIQLNPSYGYAYILLSRAYTHAGRPADALPVARVAMRLSPNDPNFGAYHGACALAHLYLGQHEEAARWARSAGRLHGDIWWRVTLVSALGHLGRTDEAKHALDDLRASLPWITLASIPRNFPTSHAPSLDHLVDGLRKAGMSE